MKRFLLCVLPPAAAVVTRLHEEEREGTWKVDGAALKLDSCAAALLNVKPLQCTRQSSIVTAAAQGRSGTFTNGLGTSSPNDREYAEYVP